MLGPKFGYYPETLKSCLIVKEKAKQQALLVFKDTAIKMTTEGQRHLRAVIGSLVHLNTSCSVHTYKYVQNEIDEFIKEIRFLSIIAKSELQAANTCFIIAFKDKLLYIIRTMSDISYHLNQLDEVITSEFILATTRGIHRSTIKRKLLSLP